MQPDRWEQIIALYDSALAHGEAGRSSFLDSACGGEEWLRQEVESLLLQDVSCDGILENVAEKCRRITLVEQPTPEFVGSYRINRKIGEGGMGIVYEAEQRFPNRVVGLKLMKPGLRAPELLHRFEVEFEALGRLHHPGIAQIYAAETALTSFGRQPYFVMEFIRGASLLDFARTKSLTLQERVELIAKVCDAAQHAHEHGIIHRDLKPSNILVEESGQPKILDFGVARLASDPLSTIQTTPGELVGTLSYMSPEQAMGDSRDVDVRSDIYSLGVILYELLAGRLPYRISAHPMEAAGAIRDAEPERLGLLNRSLRGDLETIAQTALSKDKDRRYASAAALAGDLRRYLADEPILARPLSAGYQLRKFVRRNRALTAAVAIAVVLLGGGVLVSGWEAVRAERERERAQQQSLIAEAISDFLQHDLLAQAGAAAQASPSVRPDANLTVRAALDRAASRIDSKFGGQPDVQASIRRTIGRTYFDLGLYPQAEQQLVSAVTLQRTVENLQELAGVYYKLGKYREAASLLNEALDHQARAGLRDDPQTLAIMNDLAEVTSAGGQHNRAADLLSIVLKKQQRTLGQENEDTLVTMNNLALEYSYFYQEAQAEALYQRALAIRRKINGMEHPATLLLLNNLGSTYRFLGKYRQAETVLREALAARQRILGDRHADTLTTMSNLGYVSAAEGRYHDALSLTERAFEGRRSVFGERHAETIASMQAVAQVYRMSGDLDHAESWYRKALAAQAATLGEENQDLRVVRMWLAWIKLSQRRYAESATLAKRAIAGVNLSAASWKAQFANAILGASLVGQQHFIDAKPLLVASYEGMLKRESSIAIEDRPFVAQVHRWLEEVDTASKKSASSSVVKIHAAARE